jgi:hypothetical protein
METTFQNKATSPHFGMYSRPVSRNSESIIRSFDRDILDWHTGTTLSSLFNDRFSTQAVQDLRDEIVNTPAVPSISQSYFDPATRGSFFQRANSNSNPLEFIDPELLKSGMSDNFNQLRFPGSQQATSPTEEQRGLLARSASPTNSSINPNSPRADILTQLDAINENDKRTEEQYIKDLNELAPFQRHPFTVRNVSSFREHQAPQSHNLIESLRGRRSSSIHTNDSIEQLMRIEENHRRPGEGSDAHADRLDDLRSPYDGDRPVTRTAMRRYDKRKKKIQQTLISTNTNPRKYNSTSKSVEEKTIRVFTPPPAEDSKQAYLSQKTYIHSNPAGRKHNVEVRDRRLHDGKRVPTFVSDNRLLPGNPDSERKPNSLWQSEGIDPIWVQPLIEDLPSRAFTPPAAEGSELGTVSKKTYIHPNTGGKKSNIKVKDRRLHNGKRIPHSVSNLQVSLPGNQDSERKPNAIWQGEGIDPNWVRPQSPPPIENLPSREFTPPAAKDSEFGTVSKEIYIHPNTAGRRTNIKARDRRLHNGRRIPHSASNLQTSLPGNQDSTRKPNAIWQGEGIDPNWVRPQPPSPIQNLPLREFTPPATEGSGTLSKVTYEHSNPHAQPPCKIKVRDRRRQDGKRAPVHASRVTQFLPGNPDSERKPNSLWESEGIDPKWIAPENPSKSAVTPYKKSNKSKARTLPFSDEETPNEPTRSKKRIKKQK